MKDLDFSFSDDLRSGDSMELNFRVRMLLVACLHQETESRLGRSCAHARTILPETLGAPHWEDMAPLGVRGSIQVVGTRTNGTGWPRSDRRREGWRVRDPHPNVRWPRLGRQPEGWRGRGPRPS